MILVSGATGRVGSQVVRTLRRLNLDVRALVRKGSEYFWLNDSGCRYFFGDLRDPGSLARATRDMRYLVMCANVIQEQRDNNHDSVTVRGNAALLEAAKANGVQRVVLVSCLGVERPDQGVVFAARKRAEEHVQAAGMDYTILRASVHEGPFLELAMQTRAGRPALLPGAGENRLTPLPAVDIGRMAAASLDLAAVRNRTIELGGAPLSARECYAMACEAVGVDARATVLPSPALALGRRLGRPVRRFANRLAELSVWFNDDLVADASVATSLFGLKPTPMAEAMRQGGDWMVKVSDPEEREKLIVHRQFYATVYEPGEARLGELPSGPAPRQDQVR